MNYKKQIKLFKERIDELALETDLILSQDPTQAMTNFIKALELSENLFYELSSKKQDYFLPDDYVNLKFSKLHHELVKFPEKFPSNSISRKVTDGMNILCGQDFHVLKLLDDMMTESHLLNKSKDLRKFYNENDVKIYMLVSQVYENMHKEILRSTSHTFDLGEKKLHDNAISLNEISRIIRRFKRHKVFKLIKKYMKYSYGIKKIPIKEFNFLHERPHHNKKTRKRILKGDIEFIASKLGDNGKSLKRNFNNWFKEGVENSDDGGVRLFYGKPPEIMFSKVAGISGRLVGVHEYGHALYHEYSSKRNFEEYFSCLAIEELLPQVFEVMILLKNKKDEISKTGQDDDTWLHEIIPSLKNGFLVQAATTEFSIELLKNVLKFEGPTDIEKLHLKTINSFYKDIEFERNVEMDWINSGAINRPFYSTAYLISYPISFHIASELIEGSEKGKLIIDYLLNEKCAVTFEGIFKIMGYKSFECPFEVMMNMLQEDLSLCQYK